jgi:ATP-dependent Clp protease ATP-binding subunit ClpC
MTSPHLALQTPLLVRRLASGQHLLAPVADLEKASLGPLQDALTEQKVFLSEHLARVPVGVVARFALPEGARIIAVDVLLERADLPRRIQVKTAITVHGVVVPAGEDAWVLVAPLNHTVYVRAGEALEDTVRSEVQRLAGAQQLSGWEYLQLLPPRTCELFPADLEVDRPERLPADRAASLRRTMAERQKKRHAEEVLASVSTPLHKRLPRAAPPVLAREAEVQRLAGLLEGRQRHAVLVQGPSLAGKSALVRQWLRERLAREPSQRMYVTSAAQLVAGMSGLGQWEARVRRVLEAAETLDAVLWFDNLGDLLSDHGESGRGGVDIPSALKPWIDEGRVRLVAELRADLVDVAERRHPGLLLAMARLPVEPLDARVTARALAARAGWERQRQPQRPSLTEPAVQSLVDLAERYLPYLAFPGKAFRLYDDLRAIHEQDRTPTGEPRPLGPAEVHEVFSLQTGIPAFLLREDRALLLDDVVARLAHRVVGQRDAVRRVAELVCVVKARLQPAGKPLATLLFVGPTGVGKTELARAMAQLLFGAEERLVRFDMSEFTDAEAADRLVRGAGRSEGLLTRKVREQPFCVLLLDEIEKAHPAVFDLLLQVCGDGRLSDSRGRTAYFHNAIIIMTSNLGATAADRPAAGFSPSAQDPSAFYAREVDRTFRPEFVNRLDRVVPFRPLTREELHQVASLALTRLKLRRGFAEEGIALQVSPRALATLVEGGYSARYGARALRRHLEDHLAAPVAALLSEASTSNHPVAALVTVPGEGPEHGLAPPPEALSALVREDHGLRFELWRHRSSAASRDLGGVHAIAAIRREADRRMEYPRVQELRDQVEYLETQLAQGEEDPEDRRNAAEIAELQSEHHRLAEVWARLDGAWKEVHTLEEVALQALFEHSAVDEFVTEAKAVRARFDRAMVYALLALERKRDRITLLVSELDELRALERWLGGLLAQLDARGWSLTGHLDGGELLPGDDWPAERRWGPPRDAAFFASSLRDPERTYRTLLLRISGPWAGVLLGPEGGLHRWNAASRADSDRAQLYVRRVLLDSALKETEWSHPGAQPDVGKVWEERRREAPVRDHEDTELAVTVPVKVRVEVGPGGYWPRLEEVILAALRRYEADLDLDRNALFWGPLDPP